MLSKHPERCRFPHGHSRRIELVLVCPTLDAGDMVCDFKWVKLAVADYLDAFDHALCVNKDDPYLERIDRDKERIIVFEEGDPTTELLAKRVFGHLSACIRRGEAFETPEGVTYRIRPEVRVERVRVGETPSSWAEYSADSK
ncbi:MAG: 6-carboxytetrahydropterin synthase [Phycisphaerales bacterium]|nr:6-carboxytetrahydropterin synthase [Phycisphaerales bacterium]